MNKKFATSWLVILFEYADSVYHLYVILADSRNELQNFLQDKGIFAGLHYSLPLH